MNVGGRALDLPRTFAFIAVIVMLLGYIFLYRPMETRIADAFDSLTDAGIRLDRDVRVLHRKPELERDGHTLTRALSTVDLHSNRSQTVAHFLREANAAATLHHVHIVSVAASGVRAIAPTAVATAPSPSPNVVAAVKQAVTPNFTSPLADFDELPLDLTLRGTYSDVLATIRALSTLRVLARIDVASIARERLRTRTGSPDLSANLHAALQFISEVPTNVRTRPV